MIATIARAHRFGLRRIAARLLLDHALQHARHERHAGRLDRLQVAGREEPRRAGVAASQRGIGEHSASGAMRGTPRASRSAARGRGARGARCTSARATTGRRPRRRRCRTSTGPPAAGSNMRPTSSARSRSTGRLAAGVRCSCIAVILLQARPCAAIAASGGRTYHRARIRVRRTRAKRRRILSPMTTPFELAARELADRRRTGRLGPGLAADGAARRHRRRARAAAARRRAHRRRHRRLEMPRCRRRGRLIVAPLFASTLRRASPAALRVRGTMATIEPEVAFVLARDLPPRASALRGGRESAMRSAKRASCWS